MKNTLILAVITLLAAGCIVKKTTHTLYIETDGTLGWRILEADIRSVEKKIDRRHEEEADFLDRVRHREHPALLVLDTLEAAAVDSRFLRGHRPYTLLTEGRFDSIDEILQRVFDETGLPAEVELDGWRDWRRLTVTVDWWALEEMEELDQFVETPFTEALWELLLEAETFEILLAEGEFVDALNFSIEDDGTRAVPEWIEDDDRIDADDGLLHYCLMWTLTVDEEEREAPPLAMCSNPAPR